MIFVLCLSAVLAGVPRVGDVPAVGPRVQDILQTMHPLEVSIEALPRDEPFAGREAENCQVGADAKVSLRGASRESVACWLPARDDAARRKLCEAATKGRPGKKRLGQCLARRAPVCSRQVMACSGRGTRRVPGELARLVELHARLPAHALPSAEVMALKAVSLSEAGRAVWRRPPADAPSSLMLVGGEGASGFLLKSGRRYAFQDDPRYDTAPIWLMDATDLVGRPAHAFLSYTGWGRAEGSQGDVWLRILEFDEAGDARLIAVKKLGVWFGAGTRRARGGSGLCAVLGCSRDQRLVGEYWLLPVVTGPGRLELRLPRSLSPLKAGRKAKRMGGDEGVDELRASVGAWCWKAEGLRRCPEDTASGSVAHQPIPMPDSRSRRDMP